MPTTRRPAFRSPRPYAAALLALSMMTILASCSDLLGPGSDDGRPFFYYQDEKIYLRVDTRMLTAVPEVEGDSATLRAVLRQKAGAIGKLFNTSGKDYREQKLGEKMPTMTETEAIAVLSKNGNLVKRPFVVGEDIGLVGFDEAEWTEAILPR